LQATAEELNRRGITLKQWVTQKGILYGGSSFTKSSLHGMLTNVAYIGQVNYKGHIAEAEFPGIVDRELFESVQRCLKENCQCAGARVRNKHHALLGGILRCGHCDAPMTHSHTSRRKNKVYRYYVCNRASKEGWDKCPSPSLPASEVEKFVVEEIARIGQDADLRKQVIAQHEINRQNEIAEADKARRKLERQLDTVARDQRKASGEGNIALLADCERQQRDIEFRIEELDTRLESLRQDALSADDLHTAIGAFFPAWESLTLQERIRLLRLLVQHVTYDGELGEIAITFRPSGIRTLETKALA
jgi:site-specific DNA recombinase